jgi:hypothetical protein
MPADGGWKDYVNLLHFPYALWHLSYLVLGAAIAPTLYLDRLLVTLLAFLLAVGIGAHALDELNGRPLATKIPSPVLYGLGLAPLAERSLWEPGPASPGAFWLSGFKPPCSGRPQCVVWESRGHLTPQE